jgi:stage III sporulation protein AE
MQDLQSYIANEYCAGITLYGSEEAADALFSALEENAKPALGLLCLLLGLVFIAALIKSFSSALSEHTAPVDICSALICSAAVYGSLRFSYDAVSAALSAVGILMDTMSVAMCAMYGLAGNIAAGSSAVSVLMLALQIMRLISARVLLPLILICFGCSLISGLGFDAGLSNVCSVVKRAAVFLCTASAAVVCALLSYQTVIAKTADNAALRTVKFASSSFVPVVGSSLSESVSAVSTALSSVRGAAGAGGVISIGIIIIPAALTVISSKLCMRLSAGLCGMFDLDKLKAFFENGNDILSLLLSVILTAGVIFSVACALFCIW